MKSMAPLEAWIAGIGLCGPGLPGWSSSLDVLAGRVPYVAASTVLIAPAALPPAERRRVGKGVKIALAVAFEAALNAGRDPSTLASIFTSSSGDGDNCDAICRELAGDRMISPTRFHNSVHNAPSGYWGIASGSMESSTSLCGFDHSFVAGLEDALAQLATGTEAVLLVAYDAPYPEPLNTSRPTPDSVGIALLLTRERGTRSLARIAIDASSKATTATVMTNADLERFRIAIPAARALPLLEAIAIGASNGADGSVVTIDAANGTRLRLRLEPTPATTHDQLPERQSACA